MIRLIAVLLLALLQSTPTPPPAAPPPFTARHTSYGARIAWSQPPGIHLTCLRRESILIGCLPFDAPPGEYVVELGRAGGLDGHMRARAGDVYTLEIDGTYISAPLLWEVWMPMSIWSITS